MNKKYLVVSGDSFTKGHTLGEKGSWAYHTAKKLNLELINLSGNGMSNEWISSNLISFLHRHDTILKDMVVMVGWTDFARELNFYTEDDSKRVGLITTVPQDLHDNNYEHGDDHFKKIVLNNKKLLKHFFGNEYVCLYKTYFNILHTKTTLERYNIPYLFFDSVADNKLYYDKGNPYLISYQNKKIEMDFSEMEIEFLKDFNYSDFSDKIFSKNYINFEGNSIFSWLSGDDNYKYEEGNPGHTNELGADYISNIIIKEYDKLYN